VLHGLCALERPALKFEGNISLLLAWFARITRQKFSEKSYHTQLDRPALELEKEMCGWFHDLSLLCWSFVYEDIDAGDINRSFQRRGI